MNKKRILLIDDDRGFTNILRLSLPAYEVSAENNPLRAVETAERFKPDIIFLDVIMPNLDGGTLAGELKEEPSLADVPVIFLTAIVSDNESKSVARIGGYECLTKPIRHDELLHCIQRHLGT